MVKPLPPGGPPSGGVGSTQTVYSGLSPHADSSDRVPTAEVRASAGTAAVCAAKVPPKLATAKIAKPSAAAFSMSTLSSWAFRGFLNDLDS